MRSRITYFLIALTLLGGMGYFAWTNPSYQKAFEAKWYYLMGEYDTAYQLAKEAYALDHYNRMALTVISQTEIAQKYLDYIQEGNTFLERIEKIAEKSPIEEADKVRIKMMCEVMLERYDQLAPTPLTDRDLVEKAKKIHDEFETLYRSLFER
jgi:tetratricopeptide (TPR) repeat protein